jgi:putative phage-type endonuclease
MRRGEQVIHFDHPQGSPEWLASRSGVASASRFAAVMATIKTGEAAERRNYRTDLVVERLTGKPLDSFTTKAMLQGIEREPEARLAYESRTGNLVEQVGFCRHDVLLAGASPDGLIDDDGGLEIKCPERSAHLRYLQQDMEPPEYTWQIQGGMWITGRAWWDFVSYNPDFPEHLQLIVRRIQRNDEAIKKLATEVERFLGEVAAEVERVQNLKLAA